MAQNSVSVPIPPGELIDKITILQIKSERIENAQKLHNVKTELTAVTEVRNHSLPDDEQLNDIATCLKAVNEELWDIEDRIRLCERDGEFGEPFIQLARSVYKTNDHRAFLKRQINELLGSELVEEKDYAKYD